MAISGDRSREHTASVERRCAVMSTLHTGWVARRRAGETATSIAAEAGVSRSWVSARTIAAGPFPRVPPIPRDVVAQWVADRRIGWSVASIASRDSVLAKDVARATQPHGPFPRGRAIRGQEAPLGIVALSRLVGVADPTVYQWYRRGRLPEPDSYTPAGRPRWDPSTIQEWLTTADLETCPSCGARVWSVLRHEFAVHS